MNFNYFLKLICRTLINSPFMYIANIKHINKTSHGIMYTLIEKDTNAQNLHSSR